MPRLFQPSGLPVPKPDKKYVRPTSTIGTSYQSSSPRTSGIIDPVTSKIVRSRLSTGMDPQITNQSERYTTSRPARSSKRVLHSNTKVKVTKPTGEKVFEKANRSALPAGTSWGTRKSAAVPIPPPSLLRREMQLQMNAMASKTPMGSKITAVGSNRSKVGPLEEMMTPSGTEQVLQKVITEKRLERTKYGEVLVKNIRSIGKDPDTGATIQTEEELQELNPAYPTPKGQIKEIVSVVNERDFTASYVTNKKNIVEETTKLTWDLGMDESRLRLLVEEETQDVTNILKNIHPELVNQSTELFLLRKRLQELKLSPENARMLEESIIKAPTTADLSSAEASPELMATMLNISDKSYMPKIPTAQIFNSLFAVEEKGGSALTLSYATPGPLKDVVVPIYIDENIHEGMLSENMENVSTLVHLTGKRPPEDAFARSKHSNPRRRGRRRRPYKSLSDEDPPWNEEALLISIEAVGARPTFSMHASDISRCASKATLISQTFKGIEYILDSQPMQYCSSVQLRGSQPPPWFPGYTLALSDITDSVKLAKSPSEVLFSAWKSVQPDVFSDDSIVYN